MKTLREKIDDLSPWFYEFDLNGEHVHGGIYPPGRKWDIPPERLIPRQANRRKLIIDETLMRIDVKGKAILDVGCNCAYWSSIFIANFGAHSVVGIEGRQQFIDQAQLLFDERGIWRQAAFELADAASMDYSVFKHISPFDLVLCAGLLYHVPDAVGLLEKLASVCSEAMIVDTRVRKERTPGLEPDNRYFNAIEATRDRVTPTREDIVSTLERLGFNAEVVPPPFPPGPGCVGEDDYHAGNRIFVVAKR